MASHFLQHQAMVPKTIQLPDQDNLLKKTDNHKPGLAIGKANSATQFSAPFIRANNAYQSLMVYGKKLPLYLYYYDIASGSEITPWSKFCKPQVVYRFSRNVMASITTLRT